MPKRTRLALLLHITALASCQIVSGLNSVNLDGRGTGSGGRGAEGGGGAGGGGGSGGGSVCSYDCLGGACKDGKCQPVKLASAVDGSHGTSSVRGISVDPHNVYWTFTNSPSKSTTTSSVFKVPIQGGARGNVTTGWGALLGPGITNGSLFWFDDSGFNDGVQGLLRYPLDDSAPPKAIANVTNALASFAIAAGSVVWGDNNGINKIEWNGTGQQVLVPFAQSGFGNSTVFAADSGAVYWTSENGGHAVIRRVPISGGSVITLVNDANYWSQIAAADGRLFWCDACGGTREIHQIAATGGAESSLASHGYSCPIATDGSYIYASKDGFLARVAIDGSGDENIAPWSGEVRYITSDEKAIYWVDTLSVWKVAKPPQ